MKLSQIEKRIPQTLINSKDIIQTDREYARRSSRARSTRGQENEAWIFPREMKGTMKARVAVQNRDNNPMINRRRWYRSEETFSGSGFLIMLLRREPRLEQCVLKQKIECKGEWLGKELSCDYWHEKQHFFA